MRRARDLNLAQIAVDGGVQLVRILLGLRAPLCDQIAEVDRQLTRPAEAIPSVAGS